MTALSHEFAPSRSPRPALVMRVVRAAVDAYRAFRNRREIYRLGEMQDHELADIGLTRADLNVVVTLPFGADPTTRLGAMARARGEAIEMSARRLC